MNSAGWRVLLLSMCVVVAFLAARNLLTNGISVGQWGDTVAASTVPYHLVVLSIDPGHGADLAGLRPGDLIDIRHNTPLERFWLIGQPPIGRPVTMLAQRGALQHRVTIVPQQAAPIRRILLTPVWFGYLWITLFAAVIALRRSDDPQMRALCLLLVTYAMWANTTEHIITSGSLWVLVFAATANTVAALSVAFWAACAGSFAPPASALRRRAQWLCYALVALSIAFGLMKIAGILTLFVDPIAFSVNAAVLPFALACLAASACTVLAVHATQGADRQRAIWALVPGAVLIFVGFGAEYAQNFVTSYELAWGSYYFATTINVITPLALTYVAFNRRLLDIGFVLNRAAVFAVVSTALVGAFVLVEWVANEWLSANHTMSAVVSMLVALALGLSIRYIHRFADRLVDRVLFRKRYEAEALLRRFAHEAAFITDRTALLQRALSTVKASTGTEASIIVLDDGRSNIDENDPALVSLRAWRKPLDLERYPGSALHGQFAFPMLARGELVGALVCGVKQDSEVYAPDESEALQMLADGVGSALSLLDHHRAGANGSLEGTIAELRDQRPSSAQNYR